MILPKTLELGSMEKSGSKTAIGLAEDKDGHIVGILTALLMAAATGAWILQSLVCLEQINLYLLEQGACLQAS